VTANSLINAPGFAADLAAAAAGALVGRALEWGRPLALTGLLVLVRRLINPAPVSARLAGLLAAGASLWIITATARSTISSPEASRYVYLGAVIIVLVGIELLRGVALSTRVVAIAAVLVAFCAVTGLTVMRDGAAGLRTTSETLAAELGALELAAAHVPAGFQPDPQRAPQIEAGPYLHTVRAIGSSPADTPAEIIASSTAVRTEVDETLVKLESVALAPAGQRVHLSPIAPLLANVGGSQPVHDKQCWSTRAVGPGAYTEFQPAPGGLLVRATTQPVAVVVRRFSPPLGGMELGAVAARADDIVKFPVDGSGRPWFVRLSSEAAVEVCGVS
jgi:hypothetical protein